jgi:hypothetical protein
MSAVSTSQKTQYLCYKTTSLMLFSKMIVFHTENCMTLGIDVVCVEKMWTFYTTVSAVYCNYLAVGDRHQYFITIFQEFWPSSS